MAAPRFDAAWQSRRRVRRWWRRWRWLPVLTLMLAAGWWMRGQGWFDGEWEEVARPFPVCGSSSRASGCVIDGDTLAIGTRRVRLTGYDAPELDGACQAERTKAREAQAELSRWLSAAPFELEHAEGEAPRDQYGRELREARRDGQSLADHMIARRLGRDDSFASRRAEYWC